MPEPDKTGDLIEAFLAELGRHVASDVERDAAVCTNWVLLAEWSTTDGQSWCSRYTDSNRPHWQHQGLLYHGLHGHWRTD